MNKTINVKYSTKEKLILLKRFERETMDEIINRLLTVYDATKPN